MAPIDPYATLRVPRTATEDEIRRAYRKLALVHHPDRPGGDVNVFQALGEALDVLTDPEKRRTFDRFGAQGLERRAAGQDPNPFPGGAGGFGSVLAEMLRRAQKEQTARDRKPADVHYHMRATLADVFTGVTKRITVNRTVLCFECNGVGGNKAGAEVVCGMCGGSGVTVQARRSGNLLRALMHQVRSTCVPCGGRGRILMPEDVCSRCMGSKVEKEEATVDVRVPRGAPDGHKITLRGVADHHPGKLPGDVVVVLGVADSDGSDPSGLRRRGNTLVAEMVVTLRDALCGCALSLTHLDGRVLHLNSLPGTVLGDGSWCRVRGEGMPPYGAGWDPTGSGQGPSPGEKGGSGYAYADAAKTPGRGDLMVRISVAFPHAFDVSTAALLSYAFDGPAAAPPPSSPDGSKRRRRWQQQQQQPNEDEFEMEVVDDATVERTLGQERRSSSFGSFFSGRSGNGGGRATGSVPQQRSRG